MTGNTPDSITLSWYRSPDEVTEYMVYSAGEADGDYQKVATVKERTATISGLKPGTNYYYKVAAASPKGESAPSSVAPAFTIAAWEPKPFPVRLAKNMCISLNEKVICDEQPLSGSLANLVDGSDATSCRLRRDCEIKIKLSSDSSWAQADYLMLNFRTDCGTAEWSNDRFGRTLKNYVVVESGDSTTGDDGTWKEVASGTNELLDGVIVIPNHKPKWLGIRSTEDPNQEQIPPGDRRPKPRDLILARLDVFRSAPAGYRNDYWIFIGDSLVVGDMPAGGEEGRTAWFSDLVRQRNPEYYPMVVHAGRGGEMLKDTLPRMQKIFTAVSPPNGTSTATGTIVCWETGFNDVGLGASLALGTRMIDKYQEALTFCQSNGLIMVPVRIEYSNYSLDPETLEPVRYNIFYNTLAANLGGVDVFGRTFTPYACDPKTHLPYADYWAYTRKNYATALNTKDFVHHTTSGKDGINLLWADVADKMVYQPSQP